jgi:hypothetical protein
MTPNPEKVIPMAINLIKPGYFLLMTALIKVTSGGYMKKSNAAKLIGIYLVEPMFPNAICENSAPNMSIFRHIGHDKRSDIPIRIHSPAIKNTENNALNKATANGVVPPSNVIGPRATASPNPIEHKTAKRIPVIVFEPLKLDIDLFAKSHFSLAL